MPITPTTTIDPTVMTNNWSAGLASPTNQAKLIYKYQNPKAAFNANPGAAQAALVAGINKMAAANKYANSMAKVDLNQAATNMVNYGGTNWSNAGTNKKYKYQAVSQALASAISAVKAGVAALPKGKGQNNKARMNFWFDNMGSYYGKIK